jgi:hypothetical protein
VSQPYYKSAAPTLHLSTASRYNAFDRISLWMLGNSNRTGRTVQHSLTPRGTSATCSNGPLPPLRPWARGAIYLSRSGPTPLDRAPSRNCELPSPLSGRGVTSHEMCYLSFMKHRALKEVAAAVSESGVLARSPRHGELIHIRAREVPARPEPMPEKQKWLRFLFDNYQLAINLDAPSGALRLSTVSGATGWLWPFVSARAPERETIHLWSSEGEVAVVRSPLQVAEVLRTVAKATSSIEFEHALELLPGLRSWKIPRPPYWRIAEWPHR